MNSYSNNSPYPQLKPHICGFLHEFTIGGKGGVYCLDADIAKVISEFDLQGMGQTLIGVLPWAIDPDLAELLWELSEALTTLSLRTRLNIQRTQGTSMFLGFFALF